MSVVTQVQSISLSFCWKYLLGIVFQPSLPIWDNKVLLRINFSCSSMTFLCAKIIHYLYISLIWIPRCDFLLPFPEPLREPVTKRDRSTEQELKQCYFLSVDKMKKFASLKSITEKYFREIKIVKNRLISYIITFSAHKLGSFTSTLLYFWVRWLPPAAVCEWTFNWFI